MNHRLCILVITGCLLAGADTAVIAAPVALAPAPLAAVVSPTGPVLAAGDQLKVVVYDNDDLNTTLLVAVEPSTFPMLGSIGALVGRTPQQVAELLTRRLQAGILKHPNVTVEVSAYARRSAAVLGAVHAPQRVDLPPFVIVGALQALADAGGLLEDGAGSRVLLLRRNGDGTASSTLRIIDPASGAAGDVALTDGDVLIVPRLDRIFVLGEVGRPGPLTLTAEANLTITQAISSAGGFTRSARKARVQLLRAGARTTVDISAILDGGIGGDLALRPGDVIFVPDSLF